MKIWANLKVGLIQIHSNTPLEIIVGYKNNDDNEDDEQPVITVDREAAKNADISFKGEGKLAFENKNEKDTSELNKIVSNMNRKKKAKIDVKQIDLYGNSKVELTKEEKAVVDLVTL